MNTWILLLATCLFVPGITSDFCGGSGWTAFEDYKCYKLIQTFVNQEEAKELCLQAYPLAQLASIRSDEEQKLVSKLAFNGTKITVWTGGVRIAGTRFTWQDDTKITYSNWAEGCPTAEMFRGCIELETDLSKVGDVEWRDVSCEKVNWVLCEKAQFWTATELQRVLMLVRKNLEVTMLELSQNREELEIVDRALNETTQDLETTMIELSKTKVELVEAIAKLHLTGLELATFKNETSDNLAPIQTDVAKLKIDVPPIQTDVEKVKTDIDSIKTDVAKLNTNMNPVHTDVITLNSDVAAIQFSSVPVGFIYVQLSSQSTPSLLWPGTSWTDETLNYAGVFFRAEGGGSAAFGSVQNENSPRLDSAQRDHGQTSYGKINIWADGQYSDWLDMGSVNPGPFSNCMRMRVSSGEVRPRNSAIRIWKRST